MKRNKPELSLFHFPVCQAAVQLWCSLYISPKLNKKDIDKLGNTYWDENKHLKQFLLFHARDVKIGVSLLALGFLLQIIGVWI